MVGHDKHINTYLHKNSTYYVPARLEGDTNTYIIDDGSLHPAR